MKLLPLLVAVIAFASSIPSDAQNVTVTHPDGSKTISRVDGRSNPVETSDYDSNGSLVKKTAFERDYEGKRLKMTVQSAGGSIKRMEDYSYDSKGRIASTKRTNENGSVWIRQEVYDENGNHLKSRITDPNGNEVAADKWDQSN